MTPAARAQAAIETLDRIATGVPAEQALTNWARGARYAGSGDRAAVRDLVYQVLRRLRSCAALGGWQGGDVPPMPPGRRLILGLLRAEGHDPAQIFTAAPHAPAVLTEAERAAPEAPADLPLAVALDVPDWLIAPLQRALGPHLAAVQMQMRDRAPVFVRANLARINRADAIERLGREGIEAVPHPLASAALELRAGEGKLRNAESLAQGLVEVQDAASQALVEILLAQPLPPGARVLDYCAGGGGKTLAMAAFAAAGSGMTGSGAKELGSNGPDFTAHDIAPRRMRDLPARAARAGIKVRLAETGALAVGGYDLVLADAPCSGSGTWRRQPEAKWRLTPDALAAQARVQAEVIDTAARLVRPGGRLAYATCSLLCEENEDVAQAFATRSGWPCSGMHRIGPQAGSDAFFLATFDAPLHHR